MSEEKADVNVQCDLDKLKGLNDREIEERFQKKVLPEIMKQIRERRSSDCPVCNPWSYSVF